MTTFHELGQYFTTNNDLKNKVFEFPKSINFSKVKNFSIMNSPPCSLNSLKKLEKLEKLYFDNNVDQNDSKWCVLPTFKNLR